MELLIQKYCFDLKTKVGFLILEKNYVLYFIFIFKIS